MNLVLGQLLLAAGWISFGIAHTALAGDAVRNRLPTRLGPYYRLGYNCLAALHLALILWLERAALFGRLDFAWPAPVQRILWGAMAAGVFLIVAAVLRYDLGAFSGLTEAQAAIRRARSDSGTTAEGAPEPEIEPLRTDGLNRHVRHPLYSGLFIFLWARVTDDLTLATAVWASLYLVIGARYEERRLLRLYGDAYARYRRKVPAFFPRPGRRADI